MRMAATPIIKEIDINVALQMTARPAGRRDDGRCRTRALPAGSPGSAPTLPRASRIRDIAVDIYSRRIGRMKSRTA